MNLIDAFNKINSFVWGPPLLVLLVGTGILYFSALFWMWLAAFFGMATKYAEGLLAIKYRVKGSNGNISGGPMYYIVNEMGEKYKPLAIFFSISDCLL